MKIAPTLTDMPDLKVIVTGGAGFIGSAVVRQFIALTNVTVINVDKLTYASNLESLGSAAQDLRYHFEQIDICDEASVRDVFRRHKPDAVMHLAAESHVDRSIDNPRQFLDTNVFGTYVLLEAARDHWSSLAGDDKDRFRFHHVSTDEVYGSLGAEGLFTEQSPYRPTSPYSSSKAAADHLVRAWRHTFGLPIVITNCSNNYGPHQFPEKLIPLVIHKALDGEAIPVYGRGDNVRDWLHVEDHAEALRKVLAKGVLGETYNIGGYSERTNLDVVRSICTIMDDLLPDSPYRPHRDLISFVTDRPGHDQRYAIDASKIKRDLGWTPRRSFDEGIKETVAWYLENRAWCDRVRQDQYRGERLGLSAEAHTP